MRDSTIGKKLEDIGGKSPFQADPKITEMSKIYFSNN